MPSIPKPSVQIDKPFLMAVEDVFSITGRGTVATAPDRAWQKVSRSARDRSRSSASKGTPRETTVTAL